MHSAPHGGDSRTESGSMRPMVVQLLGVVLVVRGVAWVALMRGLRGRWDRPTRQERRAVRGITLVRGLGSAVVGMTILLDLFDVAIVVSAATVVWELGHRRRLRAAART